MNWAEQTTLCIETTEPEWPAERLTILAWSDLWDVMMLREGRKVFIELAHTVTMRFSRHLANALLLPGLEDLVVPPLRRRAAVKESVLGLSLNHNTLCSRLQASVQVNYDRNADMSL